MLLLQRRVADKYLGKLAPAMGKGILKSEIKERITNNIARINIYFDSLNVETFTDTPTYGVRKNHRLCYKKLDLIEL
jgi:hypothetical protein